MTTTCAADPDVGGQHRAASRTLPGADASSSAGPRPAGGRRWRSAPAPTPSAVEPLDDRRRATPRARADQRARGRRTRATRSSPPSDRRRRRGRRPSAPGRRRATRIRSNRLQSTARPRAPRGRGRRPRRAAGRLIGAPRPLRRTSTTRAWSDSDIWWNSGRISVRSVSRSVTGSGAAPVSRPAYAGSRCAAMMPRRAEMPASARCASRPSRSSRERRPRPRPRTTGSCVVPHGGSATARSPSMLVERLG